MSLINHFSLRQFFKIVTRIYVSSLWTIHGHTEKLAFVIAKNLHCYVTFTPSSIFVWTVWHFKAFLYEVRGKYHSKEKVAKMMAP
jgi:hypothetical protein